MAGATLLSALACFAALAAQPLPSSHTPLRPQPEGYRGRPVQLILFDGPGATQTYPTSINNNGTVTGFYADENGGHGFLRGMDGSFVTFDAPGSQNIYPSSINSAGAVAGNYSDTSQHGFLRNPDGSWITFDVPGTLPSSSGNPIGINDSGTIAGPYLNGSEMHGFLRTADGSLSTIDAPASTYTYATGINKGGMVTGIYDDVNYNAHGFVRGIGGEWRDFDVPGNNFGFFPPTLSINDSGVVVGSYFQESTQGFLWRLGNSPVTFEVAGAAGTQPSGINSNGAVVGSYQDSSSTYHGFVRTPSGVVQTFSVPGAIGTFAVGINDSGAIAGSYQDASYESHGFLLIQ
ncbi:MAG: hypothetical protein ABSF64_28015 [Bryobacteraceae bacterium]|jgi:uncharacterized membrane protein